jgi:hypothetical protein
MTKFLLYSISLILLLLSTNSSTLLAQLPEKSDTTLLHEVYYNNGKLSAKIWMSRSAGRGRASCWDHDGRLMFDSEISKIHGHHSVRFEHHPNKVVSKVFESSAPDAGIQWYKSIYFFDESGNKIGEEKRSHEDLERVTIPDFRKSPEQPIIQETQQCAVIYSNELWIINESEFTLLLESNARNVEKRDTLASGDSLMLANLIQAQYFEDPFKATTISVKPLKETRRTRKWSFVLYKSGEQKNSETSTRYYYAIAQRLKRKVAEKK